MTEEQFNKAESIRKQISELTDQRDEIFNMQRYSGESKAIKIKVAPLDAGLNELTSETFIVKLLPGALNEVIKIADAEISELEQKFKDL